MITPTRPLGAVRCREQRLHFCTRQIADELFVLTFDRYSEHPRGNTDAVRIAQGYQTEERADSRQTDIARAHGIAPLLFEVVEKAENCGGIDIGDAQR